MNKTFIEEQKENARKYWNEEAQNTEQKWLTPDTWAIIYEILEKTILATEGEMVNKYAEVFKEIIYNARNSAEVDRIASKAFGDIISTLTPE